MEIIKADVTVELDGLGRVQSIGGMADFNISDKFGEQHTLSVDFEGKAFDYNNAGVEEFRMQNFLGGWN